MHAQMVLIAVSNFTLLFQVVYNFFLKFNICTPNRLKLILELLYCCVFQVVILIQLLTFCLESFDIFLQVSGLLNLYLQIGLISSFG